MLRPIRLQRFAPESEDDPTENREGSISSVAPEEVNAPPSGVLRVITHSLGPIAPTPDTVEVPTGEDGAHHLLKRTPANYLINQIYGLWLYASLFLLTILLTRSVSVNNYAVYTVAATAFNTIAYVVAFGMEDAMTTFVPRLISEHGQGAAASLIRRLLLIRVLVLIATVVLLIFALPLLATLFQLIPTSLTANIAAGLRNPDVQTQIAPIAFWVLANGLFSLLNAVYAAIMRIKIVFIVGGIGQFLILGLGFVTLHMGWGITSILWLQGTITFLGALIFAIWLTPLLFSRDEGEPYRQPLGPIFQLGFSAWFSNLVSSALLKQISLLLLIAFATQEAQAYFNTSFQLTDGANLLLVSGFGGVGIAALSASFIGNNYGRLSRIWQTLIKIETLLSAPGLVFCLFGAHSIVIALYGQAYEPAGNLFAIFLALNLLVRVMGMTIHQSTLYVLGRARLVVIAQWVGLAVVLGLGFWLVPIYGAAGALIADGLSRLITYSLMLFFVRQDLPEHYPLGYTLRILLATTIAASPMLIFHPSSKLMLAIFAVIFIILSTLLLLLIRPLSKKDLDMIGEVSPRATLLLKWFARAA